MSYLKGIGWLCHGRPLDAQPPDIGFMPEPAFQKNTQFKTFVGKKSSPFTRFIQGLALAFLFLGFSFSSFSQVNKGEYFFDADPGIGNGFNLPVTSVADSITINQNVSVSGLSAGFHTLFVRTRMSRKWSQTESRGFFITSSTSLSSGPVSQLEYFFDSDPGVGLGTKINLTASADSVERSAAIPIGSLSAGFHTIYIRAKNNRGYSLTESRSFFVTSSTTSTAGPITQLEYFFDTDPGVGLGTKLTVSPSADSSERTAIIPISSLNAGFHTIYVRAKNNRGYSMSESRSFFVVSANANNAGPISQLEYFFDTDPGIGLGTKISVNPAADSSERTAVIPVSSLTTGFHSLYIRAKNNRGYSQTESRSFFVFSASSFNSGPVAKMEYFIDTDPGVGLGTPISAFTSSDSVEVTRVITLPSNIAIGDHKFYVRSQTTDKKWSITEVKDFTIACGATEISSTQTQVCPGLLTVLSFTAGNIPGTYQWIRNEVAISGANAFNLTVNQPGSYKLRYSNGTCVDTSDALVIGTGTTTVATISPNTTQQLCAGQSVTFQGNTGTGLTYDWLRNGSLFTSGNSQINTSTLGNYSVVVTNATGCKDTSDVVAVTATVGPGDPTVFGINLWRVYAYFGTDATLSNPANYLGFYTVNSLNYNTETDWAANLSPSQAPGYAGCTMANDNFTIAMKRRGFPAGAYTLNIPVHDDGVLVLLDGVQIYNAGCCSSNPTLTLGTLGPNSTLDIRMNEGGGGAVLSFTLNSSVLQPGTIAGDQTVCTNQLPSLFTSISPASGGQTPNIRYQWQDSTDGGLWQNLSNATALTFQVQNTPSNITWFRRLAINGTDTAESNIIELLITTPFGNPVQFPVNQWNAYCYLGTNIDLTSLVYAGRYTQNSVNFNTTNLWPAAGSPASSATYVGCPIPNDNFTIAFKRKGFPTGTYTLDIPGHDDQIRVYLNGNQVFEHLSCCDTHTGIILGSLDANSEIEVRLVEFAGSGNLELKFMSSQFGGGEIAANQTQCAGITPLLLSSLSLASGGGATTITYQWQDSTAGGSWQNINNATNPTFQPGILNATRFYRRRADGNGNLVAFSNQVSITVFSNPTVNVSPGGPFVFCEGGFQELTATASTGTTIKWLRFNSVLSGQTSSTFFADKSGSYKAVATSGGTCTDTSDAVVITVNPKPAPVTNLSGPQSICSGGSLVLSLTNPQSGQTIQWKNDGNPIVGAGNSITLTQAGFYYIVATITATGCKDSSEVVTLNVVNPQVSPAGPVQICQGGSANLTASNIGTASIKWLRNEVEISGASGQIFSVTLPGIYKAVATLAGICSDTSNGVLVNVNALPSASITADADSFCVGGKTVLRANIGPGLIYQWKINGGNIANANADTLLVNTVGNYTVEVKNAANCPKISNALSIRSVNNITWFLDVDGDGYSAGVTASSCTRPQNGFLPSELTAISGDCNDLDGTINPSRQFFSFVGTSGFESSLCSPLQGTPYTNFRFEVVYTDLNNNPPPVTFPRVILDFEGNGNLNGPNDRTILMQEFDNKDKDYANGKRYFATINSLPSGLNYTTRIVSNIGTCGALIGPANYPDVFILSDIQIFANDITFDNVNPPVSSNLQVTAKINNVSDFAAQNFVVHLVNQYDTTIIYPDIIVPFLAPQSSTTVTWNIITPSVPAWCPMKVTIDYTKVIQETNELDNTAIRPFINGNFNVPGSITFSPSVVPSTIVGVSGANGTLTGSAVYTGTAVPLQNPSVAGAQVSFTIQPGGQSFTTYTNSGGFINFSFLVGLSPGTYTITGTITDFTLTSSFTLTFIVVPPVCLPDLVAQLSVSSNNIVEGQSINGNMKITNQGCQNVIDSTIVKFSQSGGTPTLPDVKIPPLATGESFNIPFTNLVFNTPGTFSVCGSADGTFIINESAEFNNQDCEIITVIPFLPDIYPTNCGVGGQQFITGQPSTINLSLYNSGGSATGPFNTRVILFREGVPVDTIDQLIPNLGRQSGTSFSFQYTYPSPGTYALSVYCDNPAPNGVVPETDETNNTSNCGILILATRPDLAFIGGCDDLKVEPIDPAFPSTHTIRARVGNSGNADAIAPILVRFTLSGGTVIEETITNSIPAGQSVLISKTYAGVAPATQTVSALIDPNNTVSEFSKLNNVVGPKSLCHEFAPVDNFCGGTWWNGTYLKNQAIFLNVPVHVQGAYRASELKTRFFVSGPGLTGTLNLGDAILTNVQESCGCPIIATLPVSFAFPEEGEYTFTMVTDPDNQYTECDESNNTIVRKVRVSGLPDMRVLSQLINPSKLNPDVNEPIIIQANYENIGLSNIDQTMKFKVLIDEIAHDSATVNGLVTGDNFTVNFSKPWSSDLVGSHIIRTIIDADNVIVESTKANNEATRAVIVGAAANMFFQVFLPNNSSPNIGQSITVSTRIGNNGDEDVEGVVQLFYINNQGDTIQIGQAPVSVASNDSTILNFPWLVVDNSTTLIGKIVNANIMEFNYDDNIATAPLGLFNVNLTSTPACAGQINGTLTASTTGGTGPFLYVWSNGFIGQTFTNGPGLYSVTVTDALGVSVLVSGSIPNIPGVRYFADADGDGYGNASIDLIDCTKPDGYVQNSLDCNDGNPAIYKTTPIPVINHTGSLTFCTGGSTTLSTPIATGTSYIWSTNVTGSSILVGAAGSYTVRATLDSGCTSTSLPIVVNVLTSIRPTASISVTPDSAICTGTLVTFSSNITGGGNLPSLEWYLNDQFAKEGPTYPTDSLKNNDKVQLVLTSDESCASPVVVLSRKITMTVTNSIQAAAGSDQEICNNSTVLSGNSSGSWTKISGTGVINSANSASTTVSNLSVGINEFIWSISGGTCPPSSDTVVITVTDPPTQSVAGSDQTICSNSTTLDGNLPQVGIGSWQVVTGTGVFVNSLLNNTDVGGLSPGENKLIWTISKSGCQISIDTVVINVSEPLTVSNPGGNQFICEDSTQMNASIPTRGIGTWTVISGTGIFENVNQPNSKVTGLSVGDNVFQWTISDGLCPDASVTATVNVNAGPSQSNAGQDQEVCIASTLLQAGNPQVGTGVWRLVSGNGTFVDSLDRTSLVNDLNVGQNLFVWVVGQATCAPTYDTVSITYNLPPDVANAGFDQQICTDSAQLAGNVPLIGTGLWDLISGSGSFDNASSASTTIRGLGIGENKIRWSISTPSCGIRSDTIILTVVPGPSVANAGPDQSVCGNGTTLAGNVPNIGTGSWSVISGSATLSDPSSASSAVNNLSIGENKFVWSISNGNCPASTDTVVINSPSPPSAANAGVDQTLCFNSATLAGNIPNIGTGSWSVISGSATLSDPSSASSAVNNLSIGENKFVWRISNGNCPASTDTVVINSQSPPSAANAGINQSLCSNNATLLGNVPNVGTGSWSVISGSATLSDPSSASSAVNNLSIGENKFVWSISNGNCPASTDTVVINSQSPPSTANAGVDQTLCSNSATLDGNVPNIGTGSWSVISGSTTLSDPSSASSAVNNLSIGENKFVWSISNGNCPASTDTVVINSQSPPSAAIAGVDQTLCSNSATLAGNVPNIGTGSWSVISGTATLSDPSSASSAVNNLSIGENKFVWSISNGNCPASTDTVRLLINQGPSAANAGSDQTICGDSTALDANEPLIGNGSWSIVSGSGNLSNGLNAKSSVTNLSTGKVTLVWTISSANCPSTTDTVSIFVNPAIGNVNAGTDQNVCGNTSTLSGNLPAIGQGTWTLVSGSGVITNPNAASTTVSNLGQGENIFKWEISNGSCPSISDSVRIFSVAQAIANAGPDKLGCDTLITLNAITGNGVNGTWTQIVGTGTIISPNADTTVVSGLSQDLNSFVWTVGTGNCISSDTVNLLFVKNTLKLGRDTTICQDSSITLTAGFSLGSFLWNSGSTSQSIVVNQTGQYSVQLITTESCVFRDTINVTVSPCTSVDEILESKNDVSVFPNPFRDKIYMEISNFTEKEVAYSLISSTGVEVHFGKALGESGKISKEISPGKLASGFYILELNYGKTKVRKKLILQ